MRNYYLSILLSVLFSVVTFAQKINHPCLLYTPERISIAKQRVKTEPEMAEAWQSIQSRANQELKRNDVGSLDYLSLAFLMTKEDRYADKIKEILQKLAATPSLGNDEMMARKPAWRSELQLAHKAYLAAIAFDAVYNELTAKERKEIAQGLYRVAMEPCIGDWISEPTRIHSLNSMGHNWWTSCACMGGVLALSLYNELPEAREGAASVYEALPQWFDFAGDVLQQKAKTFDENGGMYESLNYANFGIQEALQFRLAWKNVFPSAQLDEIPQLKNLSSFFAHVCYPRTGMLYNINIGDSHKNVTAESTLMLLYAQGVRNDDILWYISQVEQGQHRDGYFLNRPIGFLYTPQLNRAPAVPALPKSQLFADFGWAMMRTSWEKDATMLMVKSGHTWNHSHADASSFILFHKGVDILKDAGNCWYPRPEYRNYFFQSDAHNVVLFNGKGQPRAQQYHGSPLKGSLHHLIDAGNLRYLLANATGPYADQFSRYYRHFLWIDNVIYIIDDLKTHQLGHFEWLWHYNGEARKRGYDLNITDSASSVVVRPLFPRLLAQSDFVHDYPEDLYWEVKEGPTEDLKETEQYYSFHLPAQTDRVKGVTAVIIKDEPNQKNLPQMERREGKDWIGLRIKNNGKVTDLYINQLADGRLMHSNSWIEADGWTTDAYLFAVSYEEGTDPAESKDWFVSYGSALRRNKTSYFSSLSKLFVVCKEDNKEMKLWIDGQPKVVSSIRTAKRPAKLTVNNKPMVVNFKNEMVKVKY